MLMAALLSASPPAGAAESLSARLADALRPARKAQVGICVIDADRGSVVFERGADEPCKPASVAKLFTTAAALERFGPQFRFVTRAYLSGKQLWIVGGGDPAIGDERLALRDAQSRDFLFDEWADALRKRGVAELDRIVIDDSIFDEEWTHSDWPADQQDRWYQAPVGGLNFNDNCLDAVASIRAGRISLALTPPLPEELVDNALRAAKAHRPVARRAADSDVFEFAGTLARGGELGPIAAGNPRVFFGFALREGLRLRGVAVREGVYPRQLSPDALARAELLATHETPLADVLWRCNTFSQNLFAECLLKALAAYEPDGRRSGTRGSWAAGGRVRNEQLARLGLDLGGAELRDGSGLSHGNRATARQFATLLVDMRRRPTAAAFEQSLAAAGEEGSMKNRYASAALRGVLRGKTGSIRGVQTLAGYVGRDGKTLAFAVLVNGEGENVCVRVAEILAESVGGEEAAAPRP